MALEFRMFGIPIRIHPWFLLMVFVLSQGSHQAAVNAGMAVSATAALMVWAVVTFQGVLMHELAHALVGRAFGLEPAIQLTALGGVTSWQAGAPLPPVRTLAISVAGPAVGLALGLPVFLLQAFDVISTGGILGYAAQVFWWVNFGWGVFNLLPIFPLDGGNALGAFLQLFSPKRGKIWACYFSFFVLALLGLLVTLLGGPLDMGRLMFLMFLGVFAAETYRHLQIERRLGYPGAGQPLLRQAYAALEAGNAEAVSDLAEQLVGQANDITDLDEAFHLLAWGRLLADDPEAARAALDSMPGERDPDPALVGAVELELGRPGAAIPLLEEALPGGGVFVRTRLIRAYEEAAAYDRALRFAQSAAGAALDGGALHQLQTAAYDTGHLAEAVGLGRALFDRTEDGAAAFNVACCLARLGQHHDALVWLEAARRAGFRDLAQLDGDADLTEVRRLPDWPSVRARFA